MSEKLIFRSNGKLLITGEYLVLKGAKALAIPTHKAQTMEVEILPEQNSNIVWHAYDSDGTVWFQTNINYKTFECKDSKPEVNTLVKIFQHPLVQNSLGQKTEDYKIVTNLDFPKDWGLGTSSTFINNIAEWLNIDAYQLQKDIFGGSGYDIACAQYHDPIVYQLKEDKPEIEVVSLLNEITNHLYFVYLNKKQNSRKAIQNFENIPVMEFQIDEISLITEAILRIEEIETFSSLIETHNQLLSEILKIPSAQQEFSDSPYILKYLGAWGGDFMMAIAEEKPTKYFQKRGFETVLSFEEMFQE